MALGCLAVVAACSTAAAPPSSDDPLVASPSPAVIAAPPSFPDVNLPTLAPEAVLDRVPTRVRVPRFDIDLPIVAPPSDPNHFPYCDVAEYLPTMSRPGFPGVTFIYAHARTGMFWPFLEVERAGRARSLVGMRALVYTSDDQLFTYEVVDVQEHVLSLEAAYRETAEELILQTSEGPVGTPGKLMLIAKPVGVEPVSAAEAEVAAHPRRCA